MLSPIPISATAAAKKLGIARNTVCTWGARYNARKVGAVGSTVYYDFADLMTINDLLKAHTKVPRSPEERDRIRLLGESQSGQVETTLTGMQESEP